MANDINKYKNIIEDHEEKYLPQWNKHENWKALENKISRKWPQKLVKSWAYLAFLLTGVVLGCILKPAEIAQIPTRNNMTQYSDTIFNEVRTIDTLILNVTDTLIIAQNKVIQKYDTIYKTKEKYIPPNIISPQETEKIEPQEVGMTAVVIPNGINISNTSDVDSSSQSKKEDGISQAQQKQKYSRRTHKEYAPYVFINDTIKTKSIEIQFDLFRRRQYIVNKYERH